MSENNENGSSGSNGVSNIKKRYTPLMYWFLTWNNYTEEDLERVVPLFRELTSMCRCQEEYGVEGTFHLQGVFKFKQKIRGDTLYKKFGGGHWEKSNCPSANEYCMKESFPGARQWIWPNLPLPVKQAKLWKLWQTELERKLTTTDPDDREIMWYWSKSGRTGKSTFVKYMIQTYKEIIQVGNTLKGADLITLIDNYTRILLIDLPAETDVRDVSFFHIEMIKNGLITDGKLKKKAETLVFNPPHIVIFANQSNDLVKHKLKVDRWTVERLDEVFDQDEMQHEFHH